MFNWLRAKIPAVLFGSPRSGKWPAVRRLHLLANPSCAACGATTDLEVHHLTPVHEAIRLGRPELELSRTNLLTLCGGTRNCHWSVGHAFDWTAWRPQAKKLAAVMLDSNVKR